MTDADVDGSHIRTLLLTFFYREMEELLKGNHVYIAQPPLYKVKKGKAERYVKDDEQLELYFLENATKTASVKRDGVILDGDNLFKEGEKFVQLNKLQKSFEIRYPKVILEAIRSTGGSIEVLNGGQEQLDRWVENLKNTVKESSLEGEYLKIKLDYSSNDNWRIVVELRQNGISHSINLDREFLLSRDFVRFLELSDNFDKKEQIETQNAENKIAISQSLYEAVQTLMASSKKGATVQRYKGLGEMNSDQLWETTMNPETRSLVQVNIRDEEAATVVFSTLMGDQVEPRRDFIERNALYADNVDY